MDVTLKQLGYFVALADTRHYRKAAERVGISQPSLSQQIVGLEASLGLDLVERGRRGAVLTPGGREVLARARKILDEVTMLQGVAKDVRKGVQGTIKLGSTPTLGPYFLPYVMRELHLAYPALKVIVRDAAPAILQDELLDGRHDMILTQLPLRSSDIESVRLFREPLKLVVAQSHGLARQKSASDEDLRGRDLLTLSSSYRLHHQIVDLCEDLGANLREEYEGTSLDALRQMTALNMGVTFLPSLYVRSEVSPEKGDVTALSFRSDQFTRSVGLAWRRQSAHDEVIETIADIVRQVARKRFKGLVTVE